MTQPGSFGNQIPAGVDFLVRRLRDLERRLQMMEAARGLESASIGGGALQSGNYGAGVAGWALNGDGNLEVNDITLRGGIIGNDALTDPVDASYAQGSVLANGYSGVTGTVAFSYSIAKPAGFTTGILNFGISAAALNSTADIDYLSVGALIGGIEAGTRYQNYAAGEYNTMIYYSATITHPAASDTSVLLQVKAYAGHAWAADTTNSIYSTCTALWLR